MTDTVSKEQRSRIMSRIPQRDTKPEWTTRRLLHRMGYRYRLHCRDLPGKPDIVFKRKRKVIFVHGCFWHRHDSEKCRSSGAPKSNTEYWATKFRRNVARDQLNRRSLEEQGWEVLVVWECETKELELLPDRMMRFLEGA